MKPSTKTEQERRVSGTTFGKPERERVSLQGLAAFDGPAGPSDVRSVSSPSYCYRLLGTFRRQVRPRPKSFDATFRFCIANGLPEVDRLGDVRAIRQAHEQAEDAGDMCDWFERWPYDIDARGTGRKMLRPRIDPDDWAWCGRLANDLGLNKCTVAMLAVMVSLIQVDLPAKQHEWMVDELRRFRSELRGRAERATELIKTLPPSKTRSCDLAKVLGDDA